MAKLGSVLKSKDIILLTKIHIVKAMINLDSIIKSKDIILLTKVHRVKAMVFQ